MVKEAYSKVPTGNQEGALKIKKIHGSGVLPKTPGYVRNDVTNGVANDNDVTNVCNDEVTNGVRSVCPQGGGTVAVRPAESKMNSEVSLINFVFLNV